VFLGLFRAEEGNSYELYSMCGVDGSMLGFGPCRMKETDFYSMPPFKQLTRMYFTYLFILLIYLFMDLFIYFFNFFIDLFHLFIYDAGISGSHHFVSGVIIVPKSCFFSFLGSFPNLFDVWRGMQNKNEDV
jgi:hypothetical protein